MITLYQHGDSGYDDIWDVWVAEGSPAIFNTLDEDEGGRIYKAINYSNETYPQFVVIASDGPSELDTTDAADDPDEVAGRLVKKGFEHTMPNEGSVCYYRDKRGRPTIWVKPRRIEDD